MSEVKYLSLAGLETVWGKIKSKFLPLAGGTLTGPLSFKASTESNFLPIRFYDLEDQNRGFLSLGTNNRIALVEHAGANEYYYLPTPSTSATSTQSYTILTTKEVPVEKNTSGDYVIWTGNITIKNSAQRPSLEFSPSFNTGASGGELYYDVNSDTNFQLSRFTFRASSYTEGATAPLNFSEYYYLPSATEDLTENTYYYIVTNKDYTRDINLKGKAIYYRSWNDDRTLSVRLGYGSNNINHGIYSDALSAWLINGNNSNVYIPKWSSIGNSIQPVYFNASGCPVACSYSLESNVPTNAIFTDQNVHQSTNSTSSYRPLIMGATATTDTASLDTTVTDAVYVNNQIYAQASTGTIYATNFEGAFKGTFTGTGILNSNSSLILSNDNHYLYYKGSANDSGSVGCIRYNAASAYRRFAFIQNSYNSEHTNRYVLPKTPNDLTESNVYNILTTKDIITVEQGGTGLIASPSMLINLGSTTAADILVASPRPGVTGVLGIANGGTGASTHALNSVLVGNAANDIKHVASANGAFYATAANGAPVFGTLPLAQGGTEATSREGAWTNIVAPGGVITGNFRICNDGTTPIMHFRSNVVSTGSDMGSILFQVTNSGNASIITRNYFTFRQYSYTANSATRLSYGENYSLPAVTAGLTGHKYYTIYTTKNLIYSSTEPTSPATGCIWLKPV